MHLFIAEKPAMARAIAAALPGRFVRRNGYLEAGTVRVTWCIGHLLELAEPQIYNAEWARWQLAPLPLIPPSWKLRARKGGAAQLRVVRELVKSADQITHAGDPDREGQLLVDELFGHFRLSQTRQRQINRLLINDLNPSAIRKALSSLQSNQDFIPLSQSALARSHADWLYGINMTRAWTLLGQTHGYSGVLSVGRVQTPLLGLVARRDQAIESFVSQPFFQLDAKVETAQGQAFWLRWQPSSACAQWQDEQGRMLHRPLCEHVVGKISGQPALVVELKQQHKSEPAPLPFSLSALQIVAGKRYRLSAARVLELAQGLYEKHQLITYPRSDCRHLPVEQAVFGPGVGAAIAQNCPALSEAVAAAQWQLRSRAFNDKKVTAHHALVPTEKQVDFNRLSADEGKLYQLIARQYLAQFYPEHRYNKTEVAVDIAGGLFKTQAKTPLELGWRSLFARKPAKGDHSEPVAEQQLPPLQQGQPLRCIDSRILDKQTTPPEAFTDATLIAAMTGIARFVTDPAIRKVLRDTDGLGTEATRAAIIETLLKRQLLCRDSKAIHATAAGRSLIAALPEQATHADMTARWESDLERICEGALEYQQFIDGLAAELQQLIDGARRDGGQGLASLAAVAPAKSWRRKKAGKPAKTSSARRRALGKGRAKADRAGQGKAQRVSGEPAPACPSCGQPMCVRTGPRGEFLGCTGFPKCRTTQPVVAS